MNFFDPRKLVGMEETRALKLAGALGFLVRITIKDGVFLPIENDINQKRISVEVSKGIITKAIYY